MTLLTIVVALLVFSATRLTLLLFTGVDAVPLGLWPVVLLKGLWFDLLVSAVLASPVCLYETVVSSRRRADPRLRRLELLCAWGALFLLLFGAVIEGAFWGEFSTRLNFIAVDYLLYTTEVIGNIHESYPLGWILLLLGAAAGAVAWTLRPLLRRLGPGHLSARARAGRIAAALGTPLLCFALADVDQMQGLGNAYADELSGNGHLTFMAALRRNEIDYDQFYRTMPQEEADAVLKSQGVERSPLSAVLQSDMYDDASDPLPFLRRPRNVVLISVESLSASFVGTYGSTKGLTPHIDRLAAEGLKFRRLFATGTRTVRGLEALSLGIPPVPGQSVVRRPNNEHLSTVGGLLRRQGFATFFIYGGYGYFDNMNAYFNANDYDIVDRSDFPKEPGQFANIWGVADEILFENALKTLDRAAAGEHPFFAHIMTTSNHRPFTYPDGRIDIPSPGGREGAVKYTDHAIGQFIREAEGRPWFKDTLFVVTADHCASAAGKTKLPLAKYHIPLIFYAPGIVRPGLYDRVVSQIDLMPTLIEVLGKKGDDHFFGRSFFEEEALPDRAFISNYQQLGYLRGDLLTVLLPKRKVECYRVDPTTFDQTPAPVDPERLREAVAYYQTAARAFKKRALGILP